MPSNTTRIAKNTLALYFRQILIILVSLYSVRMVLEILGAEDFGIYNVVAGVVTMFGFLSGSMATASQRYFSFELGRGDLEQLKKIFSLSLLIYCIIAVLVLLLAETIGLWFVINKLVMPIERKNTALWVYQFSIISFILTILVSPYMAMIIAREDMSIYAYVSIVDAFLKLGAVIVLKLILFDKLKLYGILMLSATVITTIIYMIICIKKYKICKFCLFWNKNLFIELISYSGWSMFGASVGVFKFQIVNIILNQFFSPVVIAARSIAAQINGAVASLSNNFNMAIRPQIIKSYAAGQREDMLLLMFRGSKGTYLLMYLFVLPLILEMPMVLKLWLKNPPEYTVLFTRLILLDILIDSINFPLMTAVHATGKIKMHQSIAGGMLLLNLPVSWIILLLGYPPYSVAIVAVIITFITFIIRLLILKRLIDYSIRLFLKMVVLPISIVSILSAILPTIIYFILARNMIRLCFVIGLSIVMVITFSYCIGLNKKEKHAIKEIITKYLNSKENTKKNDE